MELRHRIDNYGNIIKTEDGYILEVGPTEALYYSNAELSDGEFNDLRWNGGYMDLEARVDYIHYGSFGFGFWNHSMRIKDSKPIWFINLYTPGRYPLKGLFIQVKNIFIPVKLYNGLKLLKIITSLIPFSKPIKIPIARPLKPDLDITDWNRYGIRWEKDSAIFYVNREEIYRVDESLDFKARFDIWIDNAVFIPGKDSAEVYRHVTNEVRRKNRLYVREIVLRRI